MVSDLISLTAANNFLAAAVLSGMAWAVSCFLVHRHWMQRQPWDEWSTVLCGVAAENLCWALHRGYYWLWGLADARDWGWMRDWLWDHRWLTGFATVGAVVALVAVMSLLTRRLFGRCWAVMSFAVLALLWLAGYAAATGWR